MNDLEKRLQRLAKMVSESNKAKPAPALRVSPTVEPEHTVCPKCSKVWESVTKGWHVCPSCRAVQAVAIFNKVCPVEYAETDIARLPARQWAECCAWSPGLTGLLLVGNPRLHKTRCAWMRIKRLAAEGWVVLPFSPTNFGSQLVDAQMNGGHTAFINRVSRAPLVLFDDLGKAKLTDNLQANLFEVIERRTSNRRPTIVTTNDDGAALAARMTPSRSEPFINRIRDFFTIVDCKTNP